MSTIYLWELEDVGLPTTGVPQRGKPSKSHPEGYYWLETREPDKLVDYMEGLSIPAKVKFMELLVDTVEEDCIPYDDGSGDTQDY